MLDRSVPGTNLYVIDICTGEFFSLGPCPTDNVRALAYRESNGLLNVAHEASPTSQLWTLDPRTLQTEFQGQVFGVDGYVQGMAFGAEETIIRFVDDLGCPAGQGVSFCAPATPNSSGQAARLRILGSGRIEGNSMVLAGDVTCFQTLSPQTSSGGQIVLHLDLGALPTPPSGPVQPGET
ncbi:MAG: hypothetical protein GY711_31285 [bacterium]|nr:hypothetical protein [bacterium]